MTVSPSKRMALCGMLVATAAVFSYLEMLFPISLGIPGVKLGLANVAVVFALYRLDAKAAFAVSTVRLLLLALLFGNGAAFLYSAAGGLVSLLAMVLLRRFKRFSVYGVSMAGGVFHNIAQVTVAVLLAETKVIFAYLTVLIPVGMATGLLIGFISVKVLRNLKVLEVNP